MKTTDLISILQIRPYSDALLGLIEMLPYGLTRKVCINELRENLLLVNAWSLACSCRGIALIIDEDLGVDYPRLLYCFERIGAVQSLEYARKAQEICGGSIPNDEHERARLLLRFESKFDALDRAYNLVSREEAAGALVRIMASDIEAAYKMLVP